MEFTFIFQNIIRKGWGLEFRDGLVFRFFSCLRYRGRDGVIFWFLLALPGGLL